MGLRHLVQNKSPMKMHKQALSLDFSFDSACAFSVHFQSLFLPFDSNKRDRGVVLQLIINHVSTLVFLNPNDAA